jgi:hypothetical protein
MARRARKPALEDLGKSSVPDNVEIDSERHGWTFK